jgi:hypothetical protein
MMVNVEALMTNDDAMRAPTVFWGAHAPSRAHFGALAEMLRDTSNRARKVRDDEGAVASTRGACAPQSR